MFDNDFKLSTITYLVQIQLNCMTKNNISNLSEFMYIQKLYRGFKVENQSINSMSIKILKSCALFS